MEETKDDSKEETPKTGVIDNSIYIIFVVLSSTFIGFINLKRN